MASDWCETTIGEQITLQRGFDITKAQQKPGSVPVISSGGVSSYHDAAMVKGPGVVLGRKGTVGTVFFVDEDFWPHDTTLWVKDFKDNDRRFVYYFFLHFAKRLAGLDVGTANPTLNRNHVHPISVLWPNFREQHEIVRVLSTLDDKIELNRKMNATLEQIAQALFKSWFVDFDPVRAKAAGRQPEGMDAETAALFPSEFEESELSQIPKGWQITKINELAELNGWTLRGTDNLERIKYIEISAVNKGNISEIAEYERGNEPSRAKRRLRHGDTVLSTVRPERGSYFLCLYPSENLIASTGFAVVSPGENNWAFVHAALTRSEIFEILGNLADGGAYPAVRPEVIGNLQLIVPNEGRIIELFHRMTSQLYEKAKANRSEIHILGELRDALLPKLISGQLRIPDIEKAEGGEQ